MGCSDSKSSGSRTVHGLTERRPLNYNHNYDDDRERLIEDDCWENEEHTREVGGAAVVQEALLRQRGKEIILWIIMTHQQSILRKKQLANAVITRWRYCVGCRRAGVHRGAWDPPQTRKGCRLMNKKMMDFTKTRDDAITIENKKDARIITGEMRHLEKSKNANEAALRQIEEEPSATEMNCCLKPSVAKSQVSRSRTAKTRCCKCKCCKGCVIL